MDSAKEDPEILAPRKKTEDDKAGVDNIAVHIFVIMFILKVVLTAL